MKFQEQPRGVGGAYSYISALNIVHIRTANATGPYAVVYITGGGSPIAHQCPRKI